MATVDYASGRIPHYLVAAGLVSLMAIAAALIRWEETDHQATLIALHLPFLAWGCVAASVTLGRSNVSRQFYGALLKSSETALTGGVFFGDALLFGGLTHGIFSVLSIKFTEDFVRVVATFGIGVIPILSLASVYDPTRLPGQQKWETGLSRVLRILTRLLLPLALGVLAVYLFWFIPSYFWRPFEEREVLIVYNASIMAVLALLASTVAGSDKQQSAKEDTALRFGASLHAEKAKGPRRLTGPCCRRRLRADAESGCSLDATSLGGRKSVGCRRCGRLAASIDGKAVEQAVPSGALQIVLTAAPGIMRRVPRSGLLTAAGTVVMADPGTSFSMARPISAGCILAA